MQLELRARPTEAKSDLGLPEMKWRLASSLAAGPRPRYFCGSLDARAAPVTLCDEGCISYIATRLASRS